MAKYTRTPLIIALLPIASAWQPPAMNSGMTQAGMTQLPPLVANSTCGRTWQSTIANVTNCVRWATNNVTASSRGYKYWEDHVCNVCPTMLDNQIGNCTAVSEIYDAYEIAKKSMKVMCKAVQGSAFSAKGLGIMLVVLGIMALCCLGCCIAGCIYCLCCRTTRRKSKRAYKSPFTDEKYNAGDRVMAIYTDNGLSYPATIVSCNNNGCYTISWDDTAPDEQTDNFKSSDEIEHLEAVE